ncbi:hypothetical protein H8E77_39925 [bacterium]|nr:hypothetical protein [bacterium]
MKDITDVEKKIKNKGINLNNLGFWAIGIRLFHFLTQILPEGSSILEIGSGSGTVELSKLYRVYSIENNVEYVGLTNKATYIYAPLKDGWYDVGILRDVLKEITYEAIIVDGPSQAAGGRKGFIDNIDLFDVGVWIIVDDINRPCDLHIYKTLAEMLNRKTVEIKECDKSFGVICKNDWISSNT